MIGYCIKKFNHYFLSKIKKEDLDEVYSFLTEYEKKIFDKMDRYDKYHGIMVYKNIKKYGFGRDFEVFCLLHDCGKEKASFYLRIMHKLGFKTRLLDHPKLGFDKMKDHNINIANLIKAHHEKPETKEMEIFQKIDDRS